VPDLFHVVTCLMIIKINPIQYVPYRAMPFRRAMLSSSTSHASAVFPAVTEPPEHLLSDFVDGDIFFASPNTQWRARVRSGVLSAYRPATRCTVRVLFDQARQRGVSHPVLFGLIPFDVRRPASLSIPVSLQVAATAVSADLPTADAPIVTHSTCIPEPEQYGAMVRQALDLFRTQDLQKIVLARVMDITLDRPLDLGRLLAKMLSRNRRGYSFALPMWGDAHASMPVGMMVGASPELLVRRTGDVIHVNPLAGSIGRHPDPDTDARLRDGLAASDKDLREHAYVVDDIARTLRKVCVDLHVPAQPSVIATDTVWHLSTVMTGRLRDASMTALDLAYALHPTPAICGTPTASALQYLPALEPFDREYYAGLVGWQRPDGDGEWVLALRCARYAEGKRLRLYAGAGIVAGSRPDQEIVETATKLETFLRALR